MWHTDHTYGRTPTGKTGNATVCTVQQSLGDRLPPSLVTPQLKAWQESLNKRRHVKPPQERREQQRNNEGGPTGATAGPVLEICARASEAKSLPSPARDRLGGGMWRTDHTYRHQPAKPATLPCAQVSSHSATGSHLPW